MRKRFQFNLSAASCYKDSDGHMHVVGVASDNKVDLGMDRMSEKAVASMATQVTEKDLLLITNHSESFGIGTTFAGTVKKSKGKKPKVELVVDFLLKSEYPQAVELFRNVASKSKDKRLQQMSIGGFINFDEDDAIIFDDDGTRVINAIELDHIATTRPDFAMNPRTRFQTAMIKDVFGDDADTAAHDKLWEGESEEVIKWLGDTTEGGTAKAVIPHAKYALATEDNWAWNTKERDAIIELGGWEMFLSAHTWFDEEADEENPNQPEIRSAYQLPHHVVRDVDGTDELITHWPGSAVAMAALLGARGGVDVPEDDREDIFKHLEKHYKEFEKVAPEFKDWGEQWDELLKFHTDQGIELTAEAVDELIKAVDDTPPPPEPVEPEVAKGKILELGYQWKTEKKAWKRGESLITLSEMDDDPAVALKKAKDFAAECIAKAKAAEAEEAAEKEARANLMEACREALKELGFQWDEDAQAFVKADEEIQLSKVDFEKDPEACVAKAKGEDPANAPGIAAAVNKAQGRETPPPSAGKKNAASESVIALKDAYGVVVQLKDISSRDQFELLRVHDQLGKALGVKDAPPETGPPAGDPPTPENKEAGGSPDKIAEIIQKAMGDGLEALVAQAVAKACADMIAELRKELKKAIEGLTKARDEEVDAIKKTNDSILAMAAELDKTLGDMGNRITQLEKVKGVRKGVPGQSTEPKQKKPVTYGMTAAFERANGATSTGA